MYLMRLKQLASVSLSLSMAGCADMDGAEKRAFLEQLFADILDGRPLISNNSVWRNFPLVHNDRFASGNKVLVGDALHTAHYSIGSGTRLALEDVIALIKAIETAGDDIPAALTEYQAARQPILEKILRAAERSAAWYEDFGRNMKLAPWNFALSYITRSGRIDVARLRTTSPKFVAGYEATQARQDR